MDTKRRCSIPGYLMTSVASWLQTYNKKFLMTGYSTRYHLVKKDIANIELSFGLNDVQRHSNDQISVSCWLSEWINLGEDNPILFSKLQGAKAPEG